MSAGAGKQPIEAILQAIFDGREADALSAIGLEFGKPATEALRFSATADSPGAKETGDEGRRGRVRLANFYALSVFLMDKELWDQAVTALGWTIRLSEDAEESFFLEESRFRKALCHKKLGQQTELLKEKVMVSADQTFLIGDKVLGIRDLD